MTTPVGWPSFETVEPDELGNVAYNANNYALGREIKRTSLAGTWHGNSNSLLVNPPQTAGDKCSGRTIIEAGNGQMWFFLREDGVFKAYADGCRDGVRLIRGHYFEGRLFQVTPFHYTMVLGAHQSNVDVWSRSYYPAMLGMDRRTCTIFLLGMVNSFPVECRDRGVVFKEQQWFTKISDDQDMELMRAVRRISDQWLWKSMPEDSAQGEQYPPECPAPTPAQNPCWGGDTLPDLP